MPQDTIFPTNPRFTGVRVTFREVILEQGLAWNVVVEREADGHRWETLHASRWEGVMLDCATTLAEDAVAAFFFGEDRDVARAAAGAHKVARAHLRRHQRVG